ncbi:unnamed protein product, partial [Didymodactylos carnosus]
STCTSNGVAGAQGPVWSLPANSTLVTASPTSQTTCNGSTLAIPAPAGNSYDPGFKGTTVASWPAGSLQTLQIFVSEIHSTENQTVYPTDGWQIRYRDGAQSGSTFSPIAFTYVNVSTMTSVGPAPTSGFQLGQTVLATITVPSTTTTDGIFQFFWRNNEVGPGVMWLSCVDVTITAPSTTPALNTTATLGTTPALRTTSAVGTTPARPTFFVIFIALSAAVGAALVF